MPPATHIRQAPCFCMSPASHDRQTHRFVMFPGSCIWPNTAFCNVVCKPWTTTFCNGWRFFLLRGWWRLWLCLSCSCQSIELACGCAQVPWLHACAKRVTIRIAAAPHICRTHRSAMFLAGHIRQTRGFTMLPESSICQTSYFAMWLASRMRQTLGFAMPPASDINQTPCCAIPVFSKPCLEDIAFCNASSKQHGSI